MRRRGSNARPSDVESQMGVNKELWQAGEDEEYKLKW